MSNGLNLRRYQSFHSFPTPHDSHKPNFVFSSDIPEKVIHLSRLYNQDPRVLDLAESTTIQFNINVQLNILLNRSTRIRPSSLIKDNLIFLAKSNDQTSINTLLVSDSKLTINPKTFVNDEVFVVTLTLKALNFLVHPDDTPSVTIDFLKDENYGILSLCDDQFIIQIENYIANTFTDNIQLQYLPHDDVLARDISTETTLEMSDQDITNEYSIDDILFLHDQDDDDAVTLIGKQIPQKPNLNLSNLLMKNPLLKQDKKDDSFMDNLTNLRHNDNEEVVKPEVLYNHPILEPEHDHESDHFIDIDDHIQSPRRTLPKESIQSPELKSPESHNYIESAPKLPNIKLKPSNSNLPEPLSPPPAPVFLQDDKLPISRKLSHNIIPPKPQKKSSFTIDLHEFENFDPTASYYKGDKKFKFIKVGKVQKFVNLFEERVKEETESNTPKINSRNNSRVNSRVGTRLSSPKPFSRTSSPERFTTPRPTSPDKHSPRYPRPSSPSKVSV